MSRPDAAPSGPPLATCLPTPSRSCRRCAARLLRYWLAVPGCLRQGHLQRSRARSRSCQLLQYVSSGHHYNVHGFHEHQSMQRWVAHCATCAPAVFGCHPVRPTLPRAAGSYLADADHHARTQPVLARVRECGSDGSVACICAQTMQLWRPATLHPAATRATCEHVPRASSPLSARCHPPSHASSALQGPLLVVQRGSPPLPLAAVST